MRNVHIAHHPVIRADGRNPLILRCTYIKADKLTDGVTVANLQTRRLTIVFLVLRYATERGIVMNLVITADLGMAFDNTMRTNARAITHGDMLTNDRECANAHTNAQLGLRVNECTRVNIDHIRPRPFYGVRTSDRLRQRANHLLWQRLCICKCRVYSPPFLQTVLSDHPASPGV